MNHLGQPYKKHFDPGYDQSLNTDWLIGQRINLSRTKHMPGEEVHALLMPHLNDIIGRLPEFPELPSPKDASDLPANLPMVLLKDPTLRDLQEYIETSDIGDDPDAARREINIAALKDGRHVLTIGDTIDDEATPPYAWSLLASRAATAQVHTHPFYPDWSPADYRDSQQPSVIDLKGVGVEGADGAQQFVAHYGGLTRYNRFVEAADVESIQAGQTAEYLTAYDEDKRFAQWVDAYARFAAKEARTHITEWPSGLLTATVGDALQAIARQK